MKITKNVLKQIIKEEYDHMKTEASYIGRDGMRRGTDYKKETTYKIVFDVSGEGGKKGYTITYSLDNATKVAKRLVSSEAVLELLGTDNKIIIKKVTVTTKSITTHYYSDEHDSEETPPETFDFTESFINSYLPVAAEGRGSLMTLTGSGELSKKQPKAVKVAASPAEKAVGAASSGKMPSAQELKAKIEASENPEVKNSLTAKAILAGQEVNPFQLRAFVKKYGL